MSPVHRRGWLPETQTNRSNRCSIHGFLFTAEMAVVGTYDLSDELACPCARPRSVGAVARTRAGSAPMPTMHNLLMHA